MVNGAFTPGKKRARLGAFCTLEGGTIRFWSARTDGTMRIQSNVGPGEDPRPFQTRDLSAGQAFRGYVALENESLSEQIAHVLHDTVWLGADRFEGFGKCRVTDLRPVSGPDWAEAYPIEQPGERLYLLAVSPLTMLGETGEPCGLNLAALADKLGVERVEAPFCGTALVEFGGYNRTWKCRAPAVAMYDRGSLFQLVCSEAPHRSGSGPWSGRAWASAGGRASARCCSCPQSASRP